MSIAQKIQELIRLRSQAAEGVSTPAINLDVFKKSQPKYYGYSTRKPYDSEDAFFKKRTDVAGMAAEDGKIVLNPYSKNSAKEQEAVAKNEAIRLWMRDNNFSADFEVTPKQAEFFKGTEYGKPENQKQLKNTLVARWLTGDPSAGKPTKEQRSVVEKVKSMLPK